MMGFFNAEQVLADLRKGESLTDEIYYLTVNQQTTSENDLAELKSRCSRLGYSFNSVQLHHADEKNSPNFFYLVRNLPDYAIKHFKEYALFEEVTS